MVVMPVGIYGGRCHVVAQATQATGMLISVQYEGFWAVNGRMCIHFVNPEVYVEPLPAGCCRHLLHDLVGLVPEGQLALAGHY